MQSLRDHGLQRPASAYSSDLPRPSATMPIRTTCRPASGERATRTRDQHIWHPAKAALAGLLLLAFACGPRTHSGPQAGASADRSYAAERKQLVDRDLRRGIIDDPRVLAAMQNVPRHHFVPESLADQAYENRPLPIGHGVTISQPYVVALMTQLADIQAGERVLEIGTGSGYQAAVLAELGAEVYSIERIEALATQSDALLRELGYEVEVRHGDGYAGWAEHAPFDAILLTAAPPELPAALIKQLAIGGKLVAPVGSEPGWQELVVVEKTPDGLRERRISGVSFVPMLPGTTPE